MKSIYKKIATAVILLLSFTIIKTNVYSQVTAEDPTSLTQEFTINIDKLGDAKMELTQKMNATQWEYFKQGAVYSNPALAKRDLERSMATYVIEDFKRDVDDVNREVKLSITVRSYAQYKGNGQWTLKIDSKNPQVTKLTDNSYMITGNTLMGSSLVQQIYKIYFPGNASDVTQTSDEFGKAIFAYNAGGGFASYIKWNNIVGLILVLVAVYFIVKSTSQRQNYNTVKV